MRWKWRAITLWVLSAVGTGVIGYYVGAVLSRTDEQRAWARSYVLAMPERCRTSSKDFEAQVQRFLEAAKRARADGRGIPVWREDCSIGAEYSITLSESARTGDSVIDVLIPAPSTAVGESQ